MADTKIPAHDLSPTSEIPVEQTAAKVTSVISKTGSISAASKIQAEQGTADDVLMTPERTKEAIAAQAPGGGDMLKCFHKDTDVLTSTGWKNIKEITFDDCICTKSQDTEEIEYHQPTKLYEYDYEGILIGRETTQLKYLVTPNHKKFVRKWWASLKSVWSEYVWERADEVQEKIRAFPMTAIWKGEISENIYTGGLSLEDWCIFLAWYLSDGSTTESKVYITQTDETYLGEIEEVLGKLASSLERTLTRRKTGFQISSKELSSYLSNLGKSYQKYIPQEIKNLPPEYLQLFLETYFKGDGHDNLLFTTSERLADDLQEISLRAGYFAIIKKNLPNESAFGTRPIYSIKVQRKNLLGSSNPTHNISEEYSGKVYCVEVPNHLLYVRLDGKPLFSGNSAYDPNNKITDVFNSANHVYDNTLSGLQAETTKGALDEIQTNNPALKYKTGETKPAHQEGLTFYDESRKSLAYYNEETDVTVNIGIETLIPVRNITGITIPNGTPVYPTGVDSDMITIDKADASNFDKCRLVALTTHDIEDSSNGYVTRIGEVGSLNTSAYPAGTILYLGETPGTLTSTRPTGGSFVTTIGVVKKSHLTEGSIVVDINISELSVEVTDTNGFTPEQVTASSISFVDGTRTFTIEPTGTNYHFYQNGFKYTKASPSTLIIPDTEGLHTIYFDAGVLTSIANASNAQIDEIIRTKVLVTYIYWNATDNVHNYFAEERHGISMSPVTHAYLHFTRGARYNSGFGLGDFIVDASGALNSHAQFSIESGAMTDEDLYHSYSSIGSTVGMPIYYLSGAAGYLRKGTNSGFSVLTTGTGRLAWNQWTGATWQLTEVTSGNYVLCHIFAINGKSGESRQIAIMGQVEYSVAGTARAGASTEIANILTKLPFQEIVAVGTVIFQTSNSYTNAVKARIISTDLGENYVDWRTTSLPRGTTPTSHSNLINLSSDDHPQYLLTTGARQLTGTLLTVASTTTIASINIPVGVNVTTPTEGMMWYNGTNLYFKPGGATVDLLAGSGGTFSWGANIAGASGTGLTTTINDNALSETIGQSIVISDTQTNPIVGLSINTGLAGVNHTAISVKGVAYFGIDIANYAIDTQIVASGYVGLAYNFNNHFNTDSAYNSHTIKGIISANAGAGYNSGINLQSYSNKFIASTGNGAAISVIQSANNGVAYSFYGSDNISSSANGFISYSISNTQTGASTIQRVSSGTSTYQHVWVEYTGSYGAIKIGDVTAPSTTTNKLYSVGGVLYWNGLSTVAGFSNPMTASGDIIYGGSIGVATRLAKGTDGQVLTLSSGVPSWQDATGGSFAWGATVSYTSGVGLTLNYGATNDNVYGIEIDGSSLTGGYAEGVRLYDWKGWAGLRVSQLALNDAINRYGAYITTVENTSTGRNTGVFVQNSETSLDTTAGASYVVGSGVGVYQLGVGGTAISVYGGNNVNSSINGLVNFTLSNTQSAVSTIQKIDTGSSAYGHIGTLYQIYNINTSARAIKITPSTTGNGAGIEIVCTGGGGFSGILQDTVSSVNNAAIYGFRQNTISASLGSGHTSYGIYQGTISRTSAGTAYGIYQGTITGAGAYGHYVSILDSNASVLYINAVTSTASNPNIINASGLSQTGSVAARTGNLVDIRLSRTNTATTGSVTDDYSTIYLKRVNSQNGIGGTFVSTGSVAKFENSSSQVAGTLTDTVTVLKLIQSTISTGSHINLNVATNGTAINEGDLVYNGTNLYFKPSGTVVDLLASGGGSGDVTAASTLTDNAIVRGDGGAKGVQTSGILIDDSDNITGVTGITATSGTFTGAGGLFLGLSESTTGRVIFKNQTDVNFIALASPTSGVTTSIYTLPASYPTTTGYVLSSTDAGVMSWIEVSGGGLSWASSIAGTSGTGLTTTISNSASSGTIAQSIIIQDTQTQNLTALFIDVGVDASVSSRSHKNIDLVNRGTDGVALSINNYASATQILGAGGTRNAGIKIGENFNTSSSFSHRAIYVINQQNAGAGKNTGIYVENHSTEWSTSLSGGGIEVVQFGAGGTSLALYGGANVNSSVNGLFNTTLSNTQSGATVLQKSDTGTSAIGHIVHLISLANNSSSARGIKLDSGSVGTGVGIEYVGQSAFTFLQSIVSSSAVPATMINFSNLSTRVGAISGFNSRFELIRQLNTAATVTDSFNIVEISRTNQTLTSSSANLTATGSVLALSNTATQTLGTLVDSVAVLKLTQDNDSLGGHILFNAYSGVPTTDGTLYFNGTDLKIRVSGVTYTFTKT